MTRENNRTVSEMPLLNRDGIARVGHDMLMLAEQKERQEVEETREHANIVVVGQLELGEGSIATELDEQGVQIAAEKGRKHLVKIEDRKCAVCIDGRGACCTAADEIKISENGLLEQFDRSKPPVRPHLPGGLKFFATVSAIAAGLSLVKDATNWEEAEAAVWTKLEAEGFKDGGHTTNISYGSKEKTECGAQDGIEASTDRAVELDFESAATSRANGLDQVAALFQGEDANEFRRENTLFHAVLGNLSDASANGIFSSFDSVAHRESLKQTNPDGLEILESDPRHPTHGHEEQLIYAIDIEGYTIDRDAFQTDTGIQAFVYDRWFVNKDLAAVLAQTDEEQKRLEIAADYCTALIANKLVAKGMWAASIRDPRLVLSA